MIALRLDPLEKQPLYLQIVEQIEEAVRHGELTDGQTLWSARKIAAHYHISYQTAERALAALAQHGVVRRSVAGGTVVIGRKVEVPHPSVRHRVIALMSCWNVWGTKPTYTTAELEMWQAAAHALTAEFWGLLSVSLGSGDAEGFSVAGLAEWCRKVSFDGAIVFGNMPERGLEWMERQGYGIVVADFEPERPYPRVVHDNYGGMRAAVTHLLKQGHRRIAYLCGDQPYHYGIRQRAYQDTLRDAGIPLDPELIVCLRSPRPTLSDALDLWLALPPGRRPTAIAAGADILAALVMKQLQERGLSVPDTFSLTGYDDEPFAPMLNPPLTTLRVSWSDMGRAAARMALDILSDESSRDVEPAEPPRRLVIPARLIERSSTKPLMEKAEETVSTAEEVKSKQ